MIDKEYMRECCQHDESINKDKVLMHCIIPCQTLLKKYILVRLARNRFVMRFKNGVLEQGCYLRIFKLQNFGMACRSVAN